MLKPSEILPILKTDVETALGAGTWFVHTTFKNKIEEQDIRADFVKTDATLGEIVKAWIIRPGESLARAHTTGKLGKALEDRMYRIAGLISVREGKATENELDDASHLIRNELLKHGRLQPAGDTNPHGTGEVAISEMDVFKLAGKHLCWRQELTIKIQQNVDRF